MSLMHIFVRFSKKPTNITFNLTGYIKLRSNSFNQVILEFEYVGTRYDIFRTFH